MKLIVGLGNPGEEYEKTRHNAGKFFLDALAKKFSTEIDSKTKIGKEVVWLLFPSSFMNKSGPSLKDYNLKYKPEDLLVIHDDLDIDLGLTKLTFGKSSGGHKGVESIIRSLRTKKFWRLRVGVAPKTTAQKKKAKSQEGKDYLLAKFSATEQKILVDQKKKIVEGVELWLKDKQRSQNILNQK